MKRRRLSSTLLKWILSRRGRIVTCQLDKAGDRYRVTVEPVDHGGNRFVELYDATATAFRRHAAVVAHLRDTGWTTVAYR